MSADFSDVIIVGSGPAGVSAAFPLVQAGLRVLMVDGGREAAMMPPSRPYLDERFGNTDQWKWMVGQDFHALKNGDAVSPKLRVPTQEYVFDGFAASNRIESKNFVTVGSLAKGGLSNAWGCGVARFSDKDFADFPFDVSDIEASYEAVTRRMGVSGATADDMSEYFGLDEWSQPPIPMDALHESLFDRYQAHRSRLISAGFRLGRSRVAALSQDHLGRKACDESGNCLWGCHRRALYSSTDEISALEQYENFSYRRGFVVDSIGKEPDGISIHGCHGEERFALTAGTVMLAAGTLATTRLALHAIRHHRPVRVQSCPTAAFLVWLPGMLGAARTRSFGLGQLSFSLSMEGAMSAFGSTFSTTGIPMTEFIRHLPMSKRYGIDLLKHLLSSCMVGNVFLPGGLSTAAAVLDADDVLKITGGFSHEVPGLMSDVAARLRKAYWRMGAWLLPSSFTVASPGADIHYACTLPMRSNPVAGETSPDGALAGMGGVYVVDGACLSALAEKSHTLTIMANADRIARKLALNLNRGSSR